MSSKRNNGAGAQPSSNIKRHQALDEVRQRIDELDDRLSVLLAERLALSSQVAKVKAELNMAIKDSSREKDVLTKVGKASSDPVVSDAIKTIYSQIFDCSRQIQRRDSAMSKDEPNYFPHVTIIGIGLIGGALARLIKDRIPTSKIVACDLDENAGAEAVALGLIDRFETDLKKATSKASLVILAAAPDANLSILEAIAPFLRKRQLVVDVTSVKGAIVDAAEQMKLAADFVGGHPLFGSERSGLVASQNVKTDGTVFCLTPAAKASEMTLRRLIRWLSVLGLKSDVMSATIHDHVIARTSHAVQLLAIALGMQISDLIIEHGRETVLDLCGPSIRQLGRLMNSPHQLWSQISAQNKTELVDALHTLSLNLERMSDAIKNNDQGMLEAAFAHARKVGLLLTTENS